MKLRIRRNLDTDQNSVSFYFVGLICLLFSCPRLFAGGDPVIKEEAIELISINSSDTNQTEKMANLDQILRKIELSEVIPPPDPKAPILFFEAIHDLSNYLALEKIYSSRLPKIDTQIETLKAKRGYLWYIRWVPEDEEAIKKAMEEKASIERSLDKIRKKTDLNKGAIKYYLEAALKPDNFKKLNEKMESEELCNPANQAYLPTHTLKVKKLVDRVKSSLEKIRLSKNKNLQLLAAAKRGDLALVQTLVEGGADLNVTDEDRNSPLMLALQYRRVETADYLLSQKTNLSLKNKKGQTALEIAARSPSEYKLFSLFSKRISEFTPTFEQVYLRPKHLTVEESLKLLNNDLPRNPGLMFVEHVSPHSHHHQSVSQKFEEYRKKGLLSKNESENKKEVDKLITLVEPYFGSRDLAIHCLSLTGGNNIGMLGASRVEDHLPILGNNQAPTLDLVKKKLIFLVDVKLLDLDLLNRKELFGVYQFEIDCSSYESSKKAIVKFYPLSLAEAHPELIQEIINFKKNDQIKAEGSDLPLF